MITKLFHLPQLVMVMYKNVLASLVLNSTSTDASITAQQKNQGY